MSNYAAKLSEAQAQELIDAEYDVFLDKGTGEFYTYEDIADEVYQPTDFDVVEITTAINLGTYPIKPNRRMFPRL